MSDHETLRQLGATATAHIDAERFDEAEVVGTA
jgi:hypothetical protein